MSCDCDSLLKLDVCENSREYSVSVERKGMVDGDEGGMTEGMNDVVLCVSVVWSVWMWVVAARCSPLCLEITAFSPADARDHSM